MLEYGLSELWITDYERVDWTITRVCFFKHKIICAPPILQSHMDPSPSPPSPPSCEPSISWQPFLAFVASYQPSQLWAQNHEYRFTSDSFERQWPSNYLQWIHTFQASRHGTVKLYFNKKPDRCECRRTVFFGTVLSDHIIVVRSGVCPLNSPDRSPKKSRRKCLWGIEYAGQGGCERFSTIRIAMNRFDVVEYEIK
jgi:hypothetical protein